MVRPQVDSPHRDRVACSVKRKRLVATRGGVVERADRQRGAAAIELETPRTDGIDEAGAKIEVIRPAEGIGAVVAQIDDVVARVDHGTAAGVVDRRRSIQSHRAAAECTGAVDVQHAGGEGHAAGGCTDATEGCRAGCDGHEPRAGCCPGPVERAVGEGQTTEV